METKAYLTALEARVVGALVEKELATPEHYPLTLASLVAACNQKSNRDPVMLLDTAVVERVLGELRREKKLAVMVHEAGARVPKFRHELEEYFGLTEVERAVLAELLLRGPQTAAELRARVPRMVSSLIDGQVEEALEALRQVRGTPMVAKLPKASGRRESRYAHQLCGENLTESDAPGPVVLEVPPSLEEERVAALENRVADLEVALTRVLGEFEAFRDLF